MLDRKCSQQNMTCKKDRGSTEISHGQMDAEFFQIKTEGLMLKRTMHDAVLWWHSAST